MNTSLSSVHSNAANRDFVDTDCRMAITGAIRKVLTEDKAAFDPRAYLKPARAAMKGVCVARMTSFGQAGNAAKLRSSMGATA